MIKTTFFVILVCLYELFLNNKNIWGRPTRNK